MTFDTIGIDETKVKLCQLVQIGQAMAQKYEVVITNPPYMSSSGMTEKLTKFVKNNYPDSKSDMFAIFIEKWGQLTKENGYQAMITQHAWMFLLTYERLRSKVLRMGTVSMAHLGARAFEEIGGEIVQTTTFVLRKSYISNYKSTYCRLIKGQTQSAKERMFIEAKNRYYVSSSMFENIPNTPIAYWVSPNIYSLFKDSVLGNYFVSGGRFKTCDDEKYLRFWWEPINGSNGWHSYNKGGDGRKYVGNEIRIVDWTNDAQTFYAKNGGVGNRQYWNSEGITWATISTSTMNFRVKEKEFFWSSSAPTIFSMYDIVTAYLNTKPVDYLLNILNPTASLTVADVLKVPFNKAWIISDVSTKAIENYLFAREDWGFFEISKGYKVHPLIDIISKDPLLFNRNKNIVIEECFKCWERDCDSRFSRFKANEEELNRIFIDIYGLQNELSPEVEDKDVTVRKADLQRDIKSLLSYAVGCMFGRYSLDVNGLAYAGGDWDEEKYSYFIPDKDNCIPITDEPYFEDDIIGLFCAWLKKVYGEDTLEENLDFIANALGNKGSTSREVIRNYFLIDFIKEHIKTYQKRPIYWLFDSGKKNGFKALVYMHRWDADTVGNLRVEYLHKTQRIYEREIQRMQEAMDNSHDSREINKASKRKEKLQKQLKETKDYDTLLAHIALSRIDIDLDDGVKVNYEKVQTGRDGKKMQILAKI